MPQMQRLVKLQGFGNVAMASADIPTPKPDQMLVKVRRSLISRGSELFRRYAVEEAVSPDIMGYSDAGEVVEVGAGLEGIRPGQRAMVVAPHAQFVVGSPLSDSPTAWILPDAMDDETATFLPLATSAVGWMRTTPIEPGDTVVILGQGIVGLLCLQTVRERRPGRVISVDAQPLRCRISRSLGADEVVDCSQTDSVAAVREMTEGKGADAVVECVGGNAGIRSFEQALQMVKNDGVIHLIALYQGGPLPLDSGRMMNKLLVAGIRLREPRSQYLKDAAQMLIDGRIRVSDIVTHRLPWPKTPDAYHLLYQRPHEALGVILEWDRE
ncbi:MAG: zinc-binding dehydrogenase [Planctomycetes bacterium]|nr:zinc-binding dehydrogenase [Planctomycetota bacterium]